MNRKVFIASNSEDGTVQLVTHHFERMGQEFYRLNTNLLPREAALTCALSGTVLTAQVTGSSGCFSLDDVKSVWYRRPVVPKAHPEMSTETREFVEAEWRACLWSLYTTLDAFWVNPPLIGHRLLEHNKLYQLKAAAGVGIEVPATIITSDHEALLAFCDQCGGNIVIKTLAGHFFKKEDGGDAFVIYTNLLSKEMIERYRDSVRIAPVMAQEYVPKRFELRVTIVGDAVFTCAIHSQDSERTKHDWRRYDFEKVRHEPYELPKALEEKLLTLMRGWGLAFGAIDMVLTPDGRYVFLEINPSGQWAWIEQLTGMPISQAIAELLANPPNP